MKYTFLKIGRVSIRADLIETVSYLCGMNFQIRTMSGTLYVFRSAVEGISALDISIQIIDWIENGCEASISINARCC